jgi:hypothetical protein
MRTLAKLTTGAAVLLTLAGCADSKPEVGSSVPTVPSEDRIAQPCTDNPCVPSYGDIPSWPVNENGQTYGIQGDSPIPPDLIQAMTTDGKTGYVLAKDLEQPMPDSPEQALEWQKANAGKTRSIPVYEQDGRTIIGEFIIGNGK